MQAKRIVLNESNDTVGLGTSSIITVPTTPREEVNFHNIHWTVSVEPEGTDVNAQGTWVLFVLKENTSQPTFIDTTVVTEDWNSFIVAIGVFSCSNQSPFNLQPQTIKTSRTLQAGDSLILQSTITGITSGAASNRTMLSAHTTRK